jgi:FKBP-type peptidyl-prolyl cis-trans isomerase FkpA
MIKFFFSFLLLLALSFTGCLNRQDEAAAQASLPTAPPSTYPDNQSDAPPVAAPAAPAGVQTTYSGLQYEVLKQGTGRKPTMYNSVKVHYHGYLPNGKVFDSSVQRGKPSTFGLNQVIPGWTEGIQLMREGAKYRFTIPAHLAYGERGSPPAIGPNQTLKFDVELLEVLY